MVNEIDELTRLRREAAILRLRRQREAQKERTRSEIRSLRRQIRRERIRSFTAPLTRGLAAVRRGSLRIKRSAGRFAKASETAFGPVPKQRPPRDISGRTRGF